jgi:hypothetical protein
MVGEQGAVVVVVAAVVVRQVRLGAVPRDVPVLVVVLHVFVVVHVLNRKICYYVR